MEWCDGGCLLSRILQGGVTVTPRCPNMPEAGGGPQSSPAQAEIVQILREAALALAFLHSLGLVRVLCAWRYAALRCTTT